MIESVFAVVLLIVGLVSGFIAGMWSKKQVAARLEQELKQAVAACNNATTEKHSAERELSAIQADNKGLNARIHERDQQLASAQTSLSLEQSKSLELINAHSDLKEQAKAHEVTAKRLHVALEEAKAQLSDKEVDYKALNDKFNGLNSDHTELQTRLKEKLANFQEQQDNFEYTKKALKTEFQNLANQVLEEKGKAFGQANQSSLDAVLKPLKEQIEGFQKRVNEVHSESVKGTASLEAELKKVLDIGMKMSDEAHGLTTVLKGEKKTVGNWGEMQLEKALQLAGLSREDHYIPQQHFKDAEGKSNYPDFVIKLPDDKNIVIDSKVSLVDYDRAVSAETEHELQQAMAAHIKAVRNHIDDLHKKDYNNLTGMRSPSFVLMFMPIEPAYIEALKYDKELFNYGYSNNVILVSYTTLMPILRTVANLWMLDQSNVEAREISEKAGDIFKQVCIVAEHLDKLGKSLRTTCNHYNKAVTGFAGQQGLHGKVKRFKSLSAKASKNLPELEPLHVDVNEQKLELIAEPVVMTNIEGKHALEVE